MQIIQTHIKLRQYGEAVQFIEDTLAEVPRTDNQRNDILSWKCACLFFLKRYTECNKTSNDILKTDSKHAPARVYKCLCGYQKLTLDTPQVLQNLEEYLRILRKDRENNLFHLLGLIVHFVVTLQCLTIFLQE